MIVDGFKKDLIVKYSEVDHNLALKPFALLNFLQDIASEHAESLGFGYSYLYPKNLFWFLIKKRNFSAAKVQQISIGGRQHHLMDL